jgi:hypothetical protein
MKPPTHLPTPDTSSSINTAKPGRSDQVLALGKKLADELGTDQRIDTLSRWMSHWIAELIHSADAAVGEERSKRMDECGNAILKLWAHRNTLRDGKRPFESLELIFRTLESLDTETKRFRYFSPPSKPDQSADETPSEKWLNRAKSADEAARGLVAYCLTKATELAIDGRDEWIKLAQSVQSSGDDDVQVIVRLLSQLELTESERLQNEIRSDIEGQIAGLKALRQLAQSSIDELKASITQS